ncbi:alpha/beta fold hydrolase [Rhodoferax sp.]|uniref:alpha/beta fold hydrolase n=1 Tax=Rhodoferax sp. TaxID=50421 RepID=UPI0025FA4421|nr:alpha/beta fold hydrolase [Rhodoferax sp.]
MHQLVFIPGLATDAHMWQDQLAAVPPAWRATVADVLAHPTSVEDMAQAVLRQHPGELVLCGASMGGIIAMEAVRQAPERVRALALLGTSARPELPHHRAQRETAIQMVEAGRLAEFVRATAAMAFSPTHPSDKADLQRYKDMVLRTPPALWVQQNRALADRPDARLHLGTVRCPTLVLCGDKDLLTPAKLSEEIASLVPGAELHLLPRCGHMLTMEQPGEVNAVLLDWLGRLKL